MGRLADIASFIYGAGRETPSIMSPAVAARKKLFGRNRLGTFEPGDLLEHLGDPGLLLGLGVGLPALGMAAARRGAKSGGRTLLHELAPRSIAPMLENLQAAGPLVDTLRRQPISGAGGFFPGQTGATRMTNQFGPATWLSSRGAPTPTVPGKTPLSQALSRTSGPISREGEVTPQYELLSDKILDVGELDKPLPQFGGRSTRQILAEVQPGAEQQAQALRTGQYGRPQTVVPRQKQSEYSGFPHEQPWTRTMAHETRRIQTEADPDVTPPWEPAPTEPLYPAGHLPRTREAPPAGEFLVSGEQAATAAARGAEQTVGQPDPTYAVTGNRPTTGETSTPRRTIIAGSRGITDPAAIERATANAPWDISTVVSGTARGADTLGEQWAEKAGIPVERFPADWSRHGKKAGYLRNQQMAENADALIAVWDEKSPGTGHMVRIAREKGIPVHIYNPAKARSTSQPAAPLGERLPKFEALTGRGTQPEAAKITQLAETLQNPGVKPTGPASEQFVENALREKLNKPGNVVKAPELKSIVSRFLAERNPRMSRELPPSTAAMPSQHTGAPITPSDKPWVGEVLSGRKGLEPGQQLHLTPQQFDQYLDRAARAGTRDTTYPIRGVDPEKADAIGEVLRGEPVSPEKIRQIRSRLGQELTPEEARAAEAGKTVSSIEQLGAPSNEGIIPGEEKMQSLGELRLSPEQSRQLAREGMEKGRNTPIPVKEPPSDLVVLSLPADEGGRPGWLLPMQSKLRQAGQEMGSEWEAIARLRQISELPPLSRGLVFGKPKPALQELAKSPHLESLLARIDQGIEQALQKAPREGFRPSPKFDELMDWTKFLTDEGRQNVLRRMERKSPEAAARLRHMWTQWQGNRPPVGPAYIQPPRSTHPRLLNAFSQVEPGGGVPARPTPKELVTRPAETTRARDLLPERPKRENLVDVLVRNRHEFADWAAQRAPRLSAKHQAETRAELGRALQEALAERGIAGVQRGEDFGLFSEHYLGAPGPPPAPAQIPFSPVGGGLAGLLSE